jgi:hypothetical protein
VTNECQRCKKSFVVDDDTVTYIKRLWHPEIGEHYFDRVEYHRKCVPSALFHQFKPAGSRPAPGRSRVPNRTGLGCPSEMSTTLAGSAMVQKG